MRGRDGAATTTLGAFMQLAGLFVATTTPSTPRWIGGRWFLSGFERDEIDEMDSFRPLQERTG